MYASGDTGENFKDRVMLGLMWQITDYKGLDVTKDAEVDEGTVAEKVAEKVCRPAVKAEGEEASV